jgi:hypothetical protein
MLYTFIIQQHTHKYIISLYLMLGFASGGRPFVLFRINLDLTKKNNFFFTFPFFDQHFMECLQKRNLLVI